MPDSSLSCLTLPHPFPLQNKNIHFWIRMFSIRVLHNYFSYAHYQTMSFFMEKKKQRRILFSDMMGISSWFLQNKMLVLQVKHLWSREELVLQLHPCPHPEHRLLVKTISYLGKEEMFNFNFMIFLPPENPAHISLAPCPSWVGSLLLSQEGSLNLGDSREGAGSRSISSSG